MSLFRANDRLAEDPTTLLVNTPEDFRLFQERKQHGIRVIAYDIDLTAEIRQAAIDFGEAQLAEWETIIQDSTYNNRINFGTFFRTALSSSPHTSELNAEFRKHSVPIPEILFDPLKLIVTCRQHASSIQKKILQVGLRVNSSFPKDFHTHASAAALSLNHNGTEYLTREKQRVITEAGRLIMFDETVEHRAAQIPEEVLAESPRVNVLD